MTGNQTSFFDDGSTTKELKKNFRSNIYKSLDEYMNDLYWTGKNENFLGEPAFVTKSTKPQRTAEEREEILIKKVHAQRRLEQHNEMGGTQFDLSDSLESFTQKATH